MLARQFRLPGRLAQQPAHPRTFARQRPCWTAPKRISQIALIRRRDAMQCRQKKKHCTRWPPSNHRNSISRAPGTLLRINAGSVTANPVSHCVRFIVRGKVQGVFFRASSSDIAQRLGLTGHAINRPDGSVEVLVCGAADAIQSMRSWLQKGPRMARVDSLQEEPVNDVVPDSFRTS